MKTAEEIDLAELKREYNIETYGHMTQYVRNKLWNWVISKILSQKQWIQVSERLPENMQTVLVWSNTSLSPTIAYFFNGDWLYYSINQECFWLNTQPHIIITHWQPLPPKPTKQYGK